MIFNFGKEWQLEKWFISVYGNSFEFAFIFKWQWMHDSFILDVLWFSLLVGWGEDWSE